MESLQAEVAPFGIHTTIVNPGFLRTELLTEQSTDYAAPSIEDYAERRAAQLEFWKSQNGKQSGDPAKLARALITIAGQEPPPRRFIAGADAIATAEQKVADLKAQVEANRELSTSLAFDELPAVPKALLTSAVVVGLWYVTRAAPHPTAQVQGASEHEAQEHDLPLVQQGRAGGRALLRRHLSG
jgi:hypothetical protein